VSRRVVCDCGATKADWLVEGESESFRTEGCNFALAGTAEKQAFFTRAAEETARRAASSEIGDVFLYAAGIPLFPEPAPADGAEAFLMQFPNAKLHFANDLVAAARAAAGGKTAVVAIAGTGSNAGRWDGKRFRKVMPSGGFILGDEGSAAALGKRFLSDAIKGKAPKALVAAARESGKDLTYESVVRAVYGSPAPSRYLGSFAPVVLAAAERNGYARSIVRENFRAMFARSLVPLGAGKLPVAFVGGFATAAETHLRAVAAEFSVPVATILARPLPHLAAWHFAAARRRNAAAQ
jgi:N-acetylglucosamine kinase-like BadF-type ATPase